MDNYLFGVVSFVAIVSMVAVTGIVLESTESNEQFSGVSENKIGYDIYMHSPRGSNNRPLGTSDSDDSNDENSRR